jgi:iron only hydrogenase large subunit-like protein
VALLNEGGKCKIHLNDEHCILCGTCLDTCTHNVRAFHDDTELFFSDLRGGRKISVIIAPAFALNYPGQYKRVLGYLKSLGVKNFYSVSYGADITTWAYLNYITENGAVGKISQPCPAIVSYIEKHRAELLNTLMPVQSPMMCMAIYLRKYMGITDDLAFISPCIAKKVEMESPRGMGLLSYNVTFAKLMEHIRTNDVRLTTYPEHDDNEGIDYGLGSLYPTPGGLRENVEFFVGEDAMVLQAEGELHVYEYLHDLPKWMREMEETPTLIDALNCSRGCNYGTATEYRHTTNNDIHVSTYKMRKNKKRDFRDQLQSTDPAVNMASLNELFKDLNLNDFICRFDNKAVRNRNVTDWGLENAYKDMYKDTNEKRIIDCRACGYKTCKDMALAMTLDINVKENCVEYVKVRLHEQMTYQRLAIQLVHDINDMVHQISNNSEKISDGSTGINENAKDAANFCGSINETLKGLQEEFRQVVSAYQGIVDIARNTNILSINANIEAAHAGAQGRGFAIIASEVGDLARKIMAAANTNQEHNNNIIKGLEALLRDNSEILERMSGVTDSAGEIGQTTGNIGGTAHTIFDKMDEIKNYEIQ